MKQVQTLVVGAGPSGLALAYGLQGDTLVLEKEATVGGLCRSIHHEGGVFDIGGHSFHTPDPEVTRLIEEFLGGGLYRQKRDARIYTNGTLIPYPFQKNFDQIPNTDMVRECEEGLRNARGNAEEAENFEDYTIRKFGQGIADHFMLPYNRKLWARDIADISCEWVSERVAAPKGEAQQFETNGGNRKPLQDDTTVAYPVEGGFEEIYRAFMARIPALKLNNPVARIDPVRRMASTQNGTTYSWEVLVSTVPLPALVRMIVGTPREIVEMADALPYMSLRVELLLTGGGLDTPIQRIYSGDPEVPPHKIALNHNSSDALRQRPRHAITAEVSVSPDKSLDVNDIAPKTVDLLCDLGVLSSRKEVVWTDHIDVKYAYPVYTRERPELVKAIKEWLARSHIYTVGRFGDWEYINSDKCITNGLALARELKGRYFEMSAVWPTFSR